MLARKKAPHISGYQSDRVFDGTRKPSADESARRRARLAKVLREIDAAEKRQRVPAE